jgi:antitoxin MazE
LFSPLLLWRLSKTHGGFSTVLVDELEARGIANLVSARWDCVASIYSVYTVYLLKEITMLVEFCKWGNSLAVRIPKTVAEALKVSVGRHAEIAIENGALVLRPIRRPKRKPTYTLEELLRGMTKENVPQEVDWGEPRGNEAW